MEIVRYRINMSRFDEVYYLLPLGDIHYGAVGCKEDMLMRKVDLILKNPNYLTIGIGDNVENNNPDNERSLGTFDKEALARLGQKGLHAYQIEYMQRIWARLAAKTIGMHPGNHEDRTVDHAMFKLYYMNYIKSTTGIDVPYLGDRAYIVLEFYYDYQLVYEYKLITMHGTSMNGKTPATVENAAYNAYNGYEDFDAILFGHTHFTFANKHYRRYLDTTDGTPQMKTKKYYIVNTGTFLEGEVPEFDSYGDKKFGGAIREPGTATIAFKPSEGDLNAYI